jgi:hypothetical protein
MKLVLFLLALVLLADGVWLLLITTEVWPRV